MRKSLSLKYHRYILYAYVILLHIILLIIFANWNLERRDVLSNIPRSWFNTQILVVIMTAPKNSDERKIIRNTWIKLETKNMKYKFFVGISNIDAHVLAELKDENNIYHDLVFLPNIMEGYQIISYKLLAMLDWAHKNVIYEYLLKVDDDSFVKLDVLSNELYKSTLQNVYIGYFVGDAHVKSAGKWAENSWFLCDYYLPYARGGGYILSYNIVKFISNNAPYLQVYNNEDTSLGVWTAPLNITRFHDVRFNTEYTTRGCNENYIIMHKQSMNDMLIMYEMYIKTKKICTKEFLIFPTYDYNWTVPPSHCCNRPKIYV